MSAGPVRIFVQIQGFCPMGCGRTLGATYGGQVICTRPSCPQPTAVDLILRDSETEHLVTFTEDGWSMKHPLRERIGDELLTCECGRYHDALKMPPMAPGTYRVAPSAPRPGWWFTPLESVAS